MRNDLADITVVLDRSGSMESVRTDTIGGFNAFLDEQRKQPGDCLVSLVQFDNQYEPQYTGRPVKEAAHLTQETFVPRGGTALLDAIAKTIQATGYRLAAMAEEQRPARVLFVIITDGGENASREFDRIQVFSMISKQQKDYNWDFIFLGANQDAISAGMNIGIGAGKSMSYAANSVGTQSAFTSTAKYANTMRGMSQDSWAGGGAASAAFDAADRDAQAKAGVDANGAPTHTPASGAA